MAAAIAALAACGDPPPVRPPAPAIDATVGPAPEQPAEPQAVPLRRESLAEMNRGVESAAAKDYLAAERHLRTAIELDADNHAAHYNLGIVLFAKADYSTAVKYFERAISLHDSPDYQLALGRALYANDLLDPARVAFATAAVAEPNLHEAHYYLGLIHIRQGRLEEALSPLKTCLGLSGEQVGCVAALADTHYRLGDFEAALEVSQRTGHDPSKSPPDAQRLAVIEGKTLLRLGRAKNAATRLGSAATTSFEAKLWWVLALAESGNRAVAKKQLVQIVKDLGDDAGRYGIDFARARLKRKWKPAGKPAKPGDGELGVDQLLRESAQHLDEKITVRGYVVWKYDCARVVGKKAAANEPERCARPHFLLGATKNPWPDQVVWVVDVPRPPRADEKKALPKETLDSWPSVPTIRVGQQVSVTGSWSTHSPMGFARNSGLLVYISLGN